MYQTAILDVRATARGSLERHRDASPPPESSPRSPIGSPRRAARRDAESPEREDALVADVDARAEDELLRESVERHLAMLRRVAMRILGCPEEAQDAVQEAILALWRVRDRPPELRGWLVRTVVHRSLHRRRSALRRRRWEEQAASESSWIACPLCDPEDELRRRELVASLEEALSRLSSDHRIVLALRAEGLEYDEIADRLGLPIGTVRSRLNRARRALRDRFDGENG